MTTAFDAAFDAWCQALSTAGFAVDRFLNPPASVSDLTSFESTVGFSMPADFKSLYLRANDQTDSYRAKEPGPGKFVMPFFGSYDFISLDRALQQYKLWTDIHSEAGDNFHSDFDHCTVRDGDPVYAEYWRPGWVPFSVDGGGNSYAVDLSPPSGGEYGQVILIGSDQDERRVLASSLTELLALAATHVDIRARISGQDKGIWRIFSIES